MKLHAHPRLRRSDALILLALTITTIAVAGFHPWSEDGGLYVAGVKWLLSPELFPHDRAFVTAHLGYSVFAPLLAATVRWTGAPLQGVLLAADVATSWLELYAALRLARALFAEVPAQWTSVALLSAWWTIPVAGTALLLNDPYVTARSFSTPLTLLALAFAVESRACPSSVASAEENPLRTKARFCLSCLSFPLGDSAVHPRRQCSWLKSVLALLAAAAFHPLMSAYAALLILCVRLETADAQTSRSRRTILWAALTGGVLLLCATVQLHSPPEPPAVVAAAISRYYWFPARWQWFELAGLAGPLIVFAALSRWPPADSTPAWKPLLRASIGAALLSITVAAIFAREPLAAHPIARMQPLRCFLLLYALLPLTVGGWIASLARRAAAYWRGWNALPVLLVLGSAAIFFFVECLAFSPSRHLELLAAEPRNPWAQAFVWAREHTPREALFALDAKYVNADGEGALVFRALAERSMVPDFSKDGGEAAITPTLADRWAAGSRAVQGLSRMSDAERTQRLQPFGVDWLVLDANAQTARSCPYHNATVKICKR